MISYDGKSHLGSAIGSRTFVESFVEEKVSKWKKELEQLSDIAITQPHEAYNAFNHGIKSKCIYLARTTPNIDHLLALLEDDASSYPPSLGITFTI